MEDRIAAYERLAYCFLVRPDEAYMNGMVAAFSAEEAAPWAASFAAFSNRIGEVGDEVALQELAVDRTRLFKGLTPDGPTPPYQSLFRQEKRSDSLAQVSGTYRQAGFDMGPDVNDAPDQLGVELMFVAFLLRRCAGCQDGAGRWLELAKSFFRENLEPFALSYVRVMREHARTDFFRGYALLLECFILEESALMG